MNIRQARVSDIEKIASVYSQCFPREANHNLWVESSHRSYPRGIYYVATLENEICGYIHWCVKNGFRERCIVELEQVGVKPEHSNKGIGRSLIQESLEYFKEHVQSMGFEVGALFVTTSEANYAESLYSSILGVSRVSVIPDYGSSDEVVLFNKIEHCS